MEHLLWLEFNLNNNGLELSTYWIDLVIPARTIYLALLIVGGLRVRKNLKKKSAKTTN